MQKETFKRNHQAMSQTDDPADKSAHKQYFLTDSVCQFLVCYDNPYLIQITVPWLLIKMDKSSYRTGITTLNK